MKNLPLQCVDCSSTMEQQEQSFVCISCKKTYRKEHGVLVCWPTEMSEMSKEEAEYHDHFDEDAHDVHQLGAYRNTFYHDVITKELLDLPAQSDVFEVGAGSGEDAAPILEKQAVYLSDISVHTVERLKKQFGEKAAGYFAVDAIAIPVQDETLDALFMVATYHHLVDHYGDAAKEFARVLKPGGKIVIGIEPNGLYFRWIKRLRNVLCFLTHTHEHEGSHADAEMEGFTHGELQKYFDDSQWEHVHIRPMWLFAGFLQYGLEFLYRAFKLKKRIVLPKWMDKLTVQVDELLFTLPFIKHLCWHWIVVGEKK